VREIYADLVFPVSSSPILKGLIKIDSRGVIREVLKPTDHGYDLSNAAYYHGWIVPGFVNAHCHLELSHLKGVIREQTGLDGFLEALMDYRNGAEDELQASMIAADNGMYECGIVFTADVSNGQSSFQVKAASKIRYHTFVERYGFSSLKAEEAFRSGEQLLHVLARNKRNHSGSLTLHAPYSVSSTLLELVCQDVKKNRGILSIHNQETESEQNLFLHGTGVMAERLQKMGYADQGWKAPGITSLQWLLRMIPDQVRMLLVHNTFTTAADLEGWSGRDAWFCLCPAANLYIENKLPDVNLFRKMGLKLVIGTDSLASNHQLNMLDELKILSKNFPDISITTLLEWACLNGAKLFGMEHLLGSIEPGKQPGLVWIDQADLSGKNILPQSRAKRI
jgi:aminodeoxyfutalosine deaminase